MRNRMACSSQRARARRVQRKVSQTTVAPDSGVGEQNARLTSASSIMARLSSETAAALLTVDTIAEGSLPPRSINRYRAYRQALLDSEQDIPCVIVTLSLFVWDLFKRRSTTTLH